MQPEQEAWQESPEEDLHCVSLTAAPMLGGFIDVAVFSFLCESHIYLQDLYILQ